MRTVLARRALALMAVGVVTAACTSGAVSTSSTTSTARPTETTRPVTNLGTLVASVTPPGSVPVDFGDAQVSVPLDWNVEYDGEQTGDSMVGKCALPNPPGALYVGMWAPCSLLPMPLKDKVPVVTMLPWDPAEPATSSSGPYYGPGPGAKYTDKTVNGLSTRTAQSATGTYVVVPELGVMLVLVGAGSKPVLGTLTRSPAAVVLSVATAPIVPKSWRWGTGGDIRVAVPSSWPTTSSNVDGPMCTREFALRETRVVLDSYAYDGATAGCPEIFTPAVAEPPENGLVIDVRPSGAWPPSTGLGPCLSLRGVTACPCERGEGMNDDQMAEIDILFMQVRQKGHSNELLEIGLAGNGMVARTILYSVRAA
jgi:hypothetical protein